DIALPAGLPQGTQIVSYRVISADGHPVVGSITFSIGTPNANKLREHADVGITGLVWLARIGVYLGLFAGVGGAFFLAWIARERTALALISAALIVGVVSAAASLGLQGLDLLGLPLSGIVAAAPWKVALGTSLGPALLIAVAAMGLALAALL